MSCASRARPSSCPPAPTAWITPPGCWMSCSSSTRPTVDPEMLGVEPGFECYPDERGREPPDVVVVHAVRRSLPALPRGLPPASTLRTTGQRLAPGFPGGGGPRALSGPHPRRLHARGQAGGRRRTGLRGARGGRPDAPDTPGPGGLGLALLRARPQAARGPPLRLGRPEPVSLHGPGVPGRRVRAPPL